MPVATYIDDICTPGRLLDIPPLAHMPDGSTCINPDMEYLFKFHLSAKGVDPGFPDLGLVVDPTLAPGETVDFQLTVDPEENFLGDLLINELLLLPVPETAVSLAISFKDTQGNRFLQNERLFHTLVFGDGFLNCCLPCPLLVQPKQTIIISVTNRELVDVRVRIVARGKRFLPYHDLTLIDKLRECWNQNPASPFWLTLDDEELVIPAGGRVQSQMSIPGGGWFHSMYPRCQVIGVAPEEIIVDITNGRIGPRLMNLPMNLGAFVATPTLAVAGFPGGIFRAASACHCPPPGQVFRGNTRLVHNFENTGGAPATVRLTYAGCFYRVDRCPPSLYLEEARRGFAKSWDNPLIADPLWEEECLPPAVPLPPPPPPEPAPPPELPGPPPLQIVSMWRPGKAYYGPGSTGALPYQLSFGVDQHGRTHLVVRDPGSGMFKRFANQQELAPFKRWVSQLNSQAGLSGLGHGEWERI